MSFKTYLQNHARTLDLRLYEHLFEGADGQAVVDELAAYQNADGGFGKALEPDLRLPDSSVIATTVAFQYLEKAGNSDADQLIDPAIRYLIDSYDDTKQRWINIPSMADRYPRAPWWDYSKVLSWAGWGNPSAEVLGYLLQHEEMVNDRAFLNEISRKAVSHLNDIAEPEQHELQCYVRLYRNAGNDLQEKLHGCIEAHIKQLTKTSPGDWQGYVATPFTFIDSPDSPFAELFDNQLLRMNAEYVREQIVDGGHWLPTWEWGQFEQEWTQAKAEWSGVLTVGNLVLLKEFGVLL